jgi:hypothetical protein
MDQGKILKMLGSAKRKQRKDAAELLTNGINYKIIYKPHEVDQIPKNRPPGSPIILIDDISPNQHKDD